MDATSFFEGSEDTCQVYKVYIKVHCLIDIDWSYVFIALIMLWRLEIAANIFA